MFDIVSVLPRHSTQFEFALERASMWVAETSKPIRVWNPDTCPPEFLPWLAWSLSVDNWRSDWGLETKRAVIRNSVEIHRRKGTLGAVRRALESLGVQSEVREWFDTGGPPLSFEIWIDLQDQLLEGVDLAELLESMRAQVDATKAARSYYTAHGRISSSIQAYTGVTSLYRLRARNVGGIPPAPVSNIIAKSGVVPLGRIHVPPVRCERIAA